MQADNTHWKIKGGTFMTENIISLKLKAPELDPHTFVTQQWHMYDLGSDTTYHMITVRYLLK